MTRMTRTAFVALVLAGLSALSTSGADADGSAGTARVDTGNPAAAGFLAAESDAAAMAVADSVMERLGGREAWNSTRFVTWRFFGNRFHLWDKHTGDIRVEGADRDTEEPYLILMNLHSKTGRAWRAGEEVVDPEPLAALLELGESAWINDSYWMFMPYKLKDSGVALKHHGEGRLLDGRTAEVLELTFRDVGRTPENKYLVYVARDTGLVEQWDFFGKASDESPRFQVPWRNWRRYGAILLSDDRGRGQHTDIAVYDTVPSTYFSSPDPIDVSALTATASGSLVEAPIYAVEGDVVGPVVRTSFAPEYPEAAKEEGKTGLVVVRTVIATDGSIRDAWVTESLDESLDQAALEAVRRWEFTPATLASRPVEVYYNLTINFQLDDDGGSE